MGDSRENEIKKLHDIERTVELFRDDLSCYAQFMERNMKQSREMVEMEDKIKNAKDTFMEIMKGEGAYSRDPLKHADNTIENMKHLAEEALRKLG